MRNLRLVINYEGCELDIYEMTIWEKRRKLVWRELTRDEQLRICNSLADYWTRLVNNLNAEEK